MYFYVNNWPQTYLGTRLKVLLSRMPHSGAASFIAILWLQPCMTFDRMILATVLTAYLCCSMAASESSCEYVEQCSYMASTVTFTQKKRKIVQ